MSWATERLEALKRGDATPPAVVQTLKLGTLDDWRPGWVKKRWQPDAAVLNGDGSLFGGYLAALADQMLGFAAMSVLADGMAFRTVNLSLQFFRLGLAEALDIEAKLVSQTKTMIAVEAEIIRARDGVLIAKAGAQQIVMALDAAAAGG